MKVKFLLLVCISAFFLSVSCYNDSNNSGSKDSLRLSLDDSVTARTIFPSTDMAVVSYDINGT